LGGRVALPNVEPSAKKWETELSRRIGAAVQARRKAMGLTAQQLAERTKELGYHVTRVAISKIEGNLRAGKFDVAELLVLAAALDIPPALLLYPGFPIGAVELLPDDRQATNYDALKWLAGDRPLPLRRADVKPGAAPEPNLGTQLIAAVLERDQHDRNRILATAKAKPEDLEAIRQLETEGATIRVRIADLRDRLGVAVSSEGERDE
jgi:transcriptional regulator with XRE-family HTH domain